MSASAIRIDCWEREQEQNPSASPTNGFQGIIGNGERMQRVFSLIERVAPHSPTVLITGETGTGKELVARALHNLSPRRGAFVVLNCSAVVETLFESELFGHTRGSFTGANADKMGLIEYANGGTLFLDEIGDMPLATQAKLLRVLQNREVQRVGALTAKKVDVRVVAATNKDLRKAVQEKQFREDLYYRLAIMEINLPPLRERLDDLPDLTKHFVREWSERLGKMVHGITDSAYSILSQHNWPGNIRELENGIGRACMMTTRETLDVSDLPEYLSANSECSVLKAKCDPMDSVETVALQLIRKALRDAHGNQTRAARLLRMTRDKLRYQMKKYGLDSENFQEIVPLGIDLVVASR